MVLRFFPSWSTTSPTPFKVKEKILLPLSLIGFLDDIFKLSAPIRYLIQTLTAFAILSNSTLYFKTFKESIFNHFPLTIILIIAITAIINFINFMDGIDGIVAGCLIISIITSCIVLNINQN